MAFLRKKLRLKFIIVLVGIASLPFFFAMTGAIIKMQDIQKRNAVQNMEHTASLASLEISEFISHQFGQLDAVKSISEPFLERRDFQKAFLEKMLFANDSFAEISMTDKDGLETAHTSKFATITPDDLVDKSEDAEFIKTKSEGWFIGDIFRERNIPFLIIGRAILDSRGNFIGSVFARVDFRIMQKVVKELSAIRKGGRAYIVDKNGIVIAHPDISQVLAKKNFSEIPVVKLLINKEGKLLPSANIYENETKEKVLGFGSRINTPFKNTSGNMQATDWFVVTELKATTALATVQEITFFTLTVLIGILVVAIIAAILFARHVIGPIEKLQKGAEQIGLDNLKYDIQIKTNDELEDLADEFNKMRVRIKKVREREQLLNREKSEFITIAAHQLRTPLSVTKWASRALINDETEKLSPKQKKLLNQIQLANERMINLVHDLLDISRAEKGKAAGLTPKKEDLMDIIKEIAKKFEAQAKERGITLTIHAPKEKLPLLDIDREKMNIVFSNLLDNAIQYNRDAGKVDIYISSKDNRAEVQIKDTGIGISKDDMRNIFSKFFRGKNAVRAQAEGSGLGLFIAKNIIGRHKGTISVESKEGQGTTVSLTLPIKV